MTQPSFLPIEKHKNPYKLTLIVLLIIKIVISAIILFYLAGAQPRFDKPTDPSNVASASSISTKCPEGTTEQSGKNEGEVLCKINPTGCIYGDTIPITDCKPQEVQKTESHNIETVENPVESVDKGK